ncbi:hypothetical protein ACLMAL_34795 [Nocardia sp. CWNU-33]|uniref:hypothetical protein n=1 Tax=Nocardia sp. CWNU-33 TaxID=3392117 RepID=UPI00398E5E8F
MKWRGRAVGVAIVVVGLGMTAITPGWAVPWDGLGIATPGEVSPPVQPDPECIQNYATDAPAGGTPVVWGIGPMESGGGGAQQTTPFTPEDRERADQALRQLKPTGKPFVVRLNRMFSADGEDGIARYKALVDRYTALGLQVELQVRYHPEPADNGNIDKWLDYVRRAVDVFGANPGVTGLQITNEVNITISANTSDGYYLDAEQALVRGVIEAKKQARLRNYSQLGIGFNYAVLQPWLSFAGSTAGFWRDIGALGGAEFRDSVDWIGFDYYPQGRIPPKLVDPYNSMVQAMALVRKCYLPLAGFAGRTPLHIDEVGWATGTHGTEDAQRDALDAIVRAINDYRGNYGISEAYWFDLRDNNSSSPKYEDYYGLLRDDYTSKPAFDRYQQLVAEYS